MTNPRVSIVMITYGHECFIEEAINGVLMQECDFEIELILANDRSPDNSHQVIEKILKNHTRARWIKYIHREVNMGMMPNFIDALNQCSGEYVALCEGDDYWTDAYKLQKQVALLDANPTYSFCFHETNVTYENGQTPDYLFSKHIYGRNLFDIKDLLKTEWFVATASMVYRRKILEIPGFFRDVLNGDFSLQLILANQGPFYFMPDNMAVYRRNDGSVSANLKILTVFEKQIELLRSFNAYFNFKYNRVFQERILKIKLRILKYKIFKFVRN
jgi:glycosyltransferase involved in cell wall biosynthesis